MTSEKEFIDLTHPSSPHRKTYSEGPPHLDVSDIPGNDTFMHGASKASQDAPIVASGNSRRSMRPGVDYDYTDRPENLSVSSEPSNSKMKSRSSESKKSRATRPSRYSESQESDSLVSVEEVVFPGVEYIQGTVPEVVGDGCTTDRAAEDSVAEAPIVIDNTTTTFSSSDLDQGSIIEARPIDEVAYRASIEDEYRNRILQEAVISSNIGVATAIEAAEDVKKMEGHPELHMSKCFWIMLVLGFLVTGGVVAGVTTKVLQDKKATPSPIEPIASSVVDPTTSTTLTCEERCPTSLTGTMVLAGGAELKRVIQLYLESKHDSKCLLAISLIRRLLDLTKIKLLQLDVDPSSSIHGSNINCWDVSLVTNMDGAFAFSSEWGDDPIFESFNETLDCWNTSSVMSMNYAFHGCKNFNQDISSWDVSNVKSMVGLFHSATSFNQPIGSWDVSSVENMKDIFWSAYSFNQPIGDWDTSNVKNMNGVFCIASAFNQPLHWDTSNVVDMAFMFYEASSFNHDLDSFSTSNVTDMSFMFRHALKFERDLRSFDVSSVTDMTEMFYSAISFDSSSLSEWDTLSVTDMKRMFASTPFSGDISSWNVSSVQDMSYMFQKSMAFNADIGQWNVENVRNMEGMFSEATSFNVPIGDWDVSQVTNINWLFHLASSFNQPLNDWDTGNVVSMRSAFDGASNFNQDIGLWDTSSVSNMYAMFHEAESFNQDLSTWNVSNVKDMDLMFQRASLFDQDLCAWGDMVDPEDVQMQDMFLYSGCEVAQPGQAGWCQSCTYG
ncbi:fibronectin domain containing protein [Nitzschia inconspicua]|uniref:Fibronectin domain containing protein n=1 Tax=Nitzschia inconspicua TaxID=303405 RepID=A0A9K3PH55_9STRA|nr:fibronectin domain containing protein [Nitzschia inconspicua]